MSDTQGTEYSAVPGDPVMAASDPAMFAALTTQDNEILRQHLMSGWYKQAAVYPVLSEPWKETSAVLADMHLAWDAARESERAEHTRQHATREAQPEQEPEAGS
jgi:hypothetical protein